MAYIGKSPTAAPLTSSDVADGIITNAKLAQDIISGDTALGAEPADTDEFLVSDAGTLKRMDYSHIKGGVWTKLISYTADNSATNVAFSSTYITSTYLDYMIVISNLVPASDDVNLHMYWSVDNGSNYLSGLNHKYAIIGHRDSDSATTVLSTGATSFRINAGDLGSASGECASFHIYLHDPLNTLSNSQFPSFHLTGIVIENTAAGIPFYGGGFQNASASQAINNVKLGLTSGNIETGKFTLYGRAV